MKIQWMRYLTLLVPGMLIAVAYNNCSPVAFQADQRLEREKMLSTSSVIINDNASFTNNAIVSLGLQSPQADEVYVTNDPKCESGGEWQPMSFSRNWTLGQLNTEAKVFAKFRSTQLKTTTACLSDSILHDNLPPEVTIDKPNEITNVVTPFLKFVAVDSGTGVANRLCSWGGSAPVECEEFSSKGNLEEGRYLVSVSAIDRAGNASDPKQKDMIVDRTPPVITILSSPSLVSNNPKAEFKFSANDNLSEVASIKCAWGNSSNFTSCASPLSQTLAAGLHSLTIKAIDAAGNSAEVTRSFTIDLSAPTVQILSGPSDFSRSNSAAFTFTGSDDGKTITKFDCRVDSGSWASCSSPANYANLSEGQHSFEVRGYDSSGNVSAPAQALWLIDTKAPIVTFVSTPPANSNKQPTFKYNASDSGAGIDKVQCSLDGGAFVDCPVSTMSYTNLPSGKHSFVVRAIDRAGNSTDSTMVNFTIDLTPPTVRITTAPSGFLNRASFLFGFTASDDLSLDRVECRLNSAAFSRCDSVSSHQVSGMSDGAQVFNVRAIDSAGNVSGEDSATFIVDQTAPVITYSLLPVSPIMSTKSNSLNFTITETGSGIASLVCTIGTATLNCSSGANLTLPSLTVGTHEFKVVATDRAGNAKTDIKKIEVTVGSVTQTVIADNSPVYQKADILFVVDESISMAKVIENVRAGFNSLAASNYLADTLMAVVNTAPVRLKTDGLPQWGTPFTTTASVADQPGFNRIVSSATINNYVTKYPADSSLFPMKGCAEWFAPTAINADGQKCLTANTQVALKGTGTEAGAVAVMQLAQREKTISKKLFRDGSIANVIFVSDTHDPGNAYYGKSGAYAAIPSVDAVRAAILANNPSVVSVKFHGIVPLPLAGDSKLTGLNYVGQLPTGTSSVSSEGLYDFSYLNFIKATGGFAMHPINNDWTAAIQKIVESTAQPADLVITLDQRASKITRLSVQGVVLAATDYELKPDGLTVVVKKNASWPSKPSVEVSYDLF